MPSPLPPGFQVDKKLSEQYGTIVAVNPQTGKRLRMKQPADSPAVPLTPGSESRTRVALGFGPSVSAQRQMEASERGPDGKRINPLNRDWGAAVIDGLDDNKIAQFFGANTGALARWVGGQDFQDYDQAAKSFESAFLPIISGAAVTPSEAQRMLRASLPQLGDNPETLAAKAKNRAMMINAAADLGGRPRPFPDVGTWDFQTGAASAEGGGQQRRRKYNKATGRFD